MSPIHACFYTSMSTGHVGLRFHCQVGSLMLINGSLCGNYIYNWRHFWELTTFCGSYYEKRFTTETIFVTSRNFTETVMDFSLSYQLTAIIHSFLGDSEKIFSTSIPVILMSATFVIQTGLFLFLIEFGIEMIALETVISVVKNEFSWSWFGINQNAYLFSTEMEGSWCGI